MLLYNLKDKIAKAADIYDEAVLPFTGRSKKTGLLNNLEGENLTLYELIGHLFLLLRSPAFIYVP